MPSTELIDIACELKVESPGAYKIFDGLRTEWVPKSQVEMKAATERVNDWVCTMPIWLAKEKGFI